MVLSNKNHYARQYIDIFILKHGDKLHTRIPTDTNGMQTSFHLINLSIHKKNQIRSPIHLKLLPTF